MREVGAENIGMQGGKMSEALMFREKEPASGQKSPGSESVRGEEVHIRRGHIAKAVH